MIDLHMHTKYSDGTDTEVEILENCEKVGLSVISITDHNNCDVYYKLKKINISDYFSGKIIPGVELNTKVAGIPIEILGYNINYKKMNDLCKKTYLSPEKRNELEFERLVEKCKKYGIILDDNIIEQFDKNDFASVTIHKNIINHKENKSKINERSWNNNIDFYRDYMSNPDTLIYVEMEDLVPDLDTAIDIVKESDGLVFIPHIYEYRDNTKKVLDYILKNGRLDGIECYYSSFTNEQHEHLLNLAKEKNIFISGGTDYHGNRTPRANLGIGKGNLCIPDEIQKKWAKYIN